MDQNLPEKIAKNKNFLVSKMFYFDADTEVNDAFNEYVRKKAYDLWKKEGMPEGKDMEILIKAEEEGKKMFQSKKKQQEDTAAISVPELDADFNAQEITKRINKLETAYADLLDIVKKIDDGRDVSQLKNSGTQSVQFESEVQPAAYLAKDGESPESKIMQLQQENSALRQKISEAENNLEKQQQSLAALESKLNTMDYSDKKREVLQEELNAANSEKENLRKSLEEAKQKNTELTAKLVLLENEINDILHRKKEKPYGPEQNKSEKNLIDKIKELEKERLLLFKTVRDMEEEKKMIPYLDQKCMVYEEELKRIEAEKNSMEPLINRLEKERKEMAEKIIMLEEKRNDRLALEQEKGMLKKKILELEEERNKLLHSLSGLKDKVLSVEDKSLGVDGLKSEFEKIVTEDAMLREKLKDMCAISLEHSNQQKVINELEQELNNKLEQLAEMTEREKELLSKISEFTQRHKAPYILDRKKLEELKEFTLEAIQARRWKSPEFVNGAYDAIGLFYRTILSEEPVKKQSADDVPE